MLLKNIYSIKVDVKAIINISVSYITIITTQIY